MNLFFVFYLFFFSLVSLVFVRKHLFLCLISLEFIVLLLLFLILMYCLLFEYNFYIYVIFMTFYVCEGVLGLSVLVYMIRCYGNDYLNSMFLW
uniref:NADH-ubiquinone oxidoreductase chain 4L n=1 Tax=Sophonia fuscomarginata TaxID=3092774 RepID=A0AAF0YX93_9HEMI|nr:NADH dehydrogenase subunit 4L [Sophonia fuscomarginata]WPC85269.1 NADH dehydrogenase subunit 4L [Sophonia fuscomarginata]